MIATAETQSTARVPLGARQQLTAFDMSEFEKKATRIQKIVDVRKANTIARNEKIRKRFDELFNKDRMRYDDVMEELCREFNLAMSTIHTALKN